MTFIVGAAFPLEPFNTCLRNGVAGEKLSDVLAELKPEGPCTSPISLQSAAR